MLSKRLKEIAKYIENGSVVADIGCDHALLSIFLIEEGIASKAIASDINQGPINNAKRNIARKNYNHLIETRLGAGLQTINVGEASNCIISGMGGSLIRDILKESYDVFQDFDVVVTQANNSNYQLRQFMVNNGYVIDSESLVEENNIIYEVIKFIKGSRIYTDLELKYGPINITENSELFKKHISNILESKEKILSNIPISNEGKQSEFGEEISELKSLLK